MESTTMEHGMKLNKKQFAALAVVAVLLLAGVFFFAEKPANGAQIVSASVTRSIDSSGNPTGATMVFDSKTDKVVYVTLKLKNAKQSTRISYVRYLNDKYIDSKVASPAADGAQNLYFTFEKGVGTYPSGNYRVVAFVDGVRAAEVHYLFK